MKYILGLDVGTTSVGWCIRNLEKNRVENLGIRMFDKAEDPKTGDSLAKPRREARSARRRTRRKRQRLSEIKELLVRVGIVDRATFDGLFARTTAEQSPWLLREKALHECLTPVEWARVLIHLAKRRGFQSNRKSANADEKSDEGKMLKGVRFISECRRTNEYLTVGQMFAQDAHFTERKRNRYGNYSHTVGREEIKGEIQTLFLRQREFGNPFTTEDFLTVYIEIWGRQLPFSTPQQILNMTGMCTFEKGEKRAPRHSYSFERFMLLQKINHLQIGEGYKKEPLNAEQRRMVVDLAYKNSSVKFQQIRKKLDLPENSRFNLVVYKRDKSVEACEEHVFVQLKFFHGLGAVIKKRLGNTAWINLAGKTQYLDDIGYALTFFKTKEDVSAWLGERGVAGEVIDAVWELEFAKVGNLSFKALEKILPFLEEGAMYNDAVARAGYTFSSTCGGGSSGLLPQPSPDDIRNPVVFRSLNQARKLINAVIRRYGIPHYIHIELAREFYKKRDDLKNAEKIREKNREEKELAQKELGEEYGITAKPGDVLKNRLWHEQGGKCVYSLKSIDRDRMLNDGYCQVDHILPRSRSFDDGYMNKVLVLTAENQKKGDRTPYEYLGLNEEAWEKYKIQIRTIPSIPQRKLEKLFMERFDDETAAEYRERALNDTRYICRYLKNFIEDNLRFPEDDAARRRVFTLSGQVTAMLRWLWGLKKERDTGSWHHALDAAVIAAADRSTIMEVENYFRQRERRYAGDFSAYEENRLDGHCPPPWLHFREEVVARLAADPLAEIRRLNFSTYDEEFRQTVKPVFPSYSPFRKISGKVHKETVRSKKLLAAEGVTYVKQQLASVATEKAAKNMLDDLSGMREANSALYLSDVPLYDALIKRLQEALANGEKKPFAAGFYKPTRSGKPGPQVYSVKITSSDGVSGFALRGGIVAKDNMVRIDVFRREEKKRSRFYIVPVYLRDFQYSSPPILAIKANVPETKWLEMDDSCVFLFSLYPNDLIKIVFRDGDDVLGYYIDCDRSTGAIKLNVVANGRENVDRFSISSKALSVEKMVVDLLGNVYPVKKEKRQWPGGTSSSQIPPS